MHWQVPVIWLNWGIQCRTSFARPWVVLQPGWMHILSLGFSFVCRQWTLRTLACKVRLLAHLLVPTRDSLSGFLRHGYRLLLDEVFVISRIIIVEASLRLRLITLTETFNILDITKTESNNCFITHWTKKWKSCFCFFTDRKKHKVRESDDMITLPSWTAVVHDMITWHWVSLTW